MEQECIECGDLFLPHPIFNKPVCEDCEDEYSRCDNCSTWFKKNDTPYCEECLPDFSTCDNCGTWQSSEDLIWVESEGNNFCEKCIDSHFFTCDDCDRKFRHRHRIETAYGTDICEDCYSNNFFTCEDCESVYHTEDYGGDSYCRQCYQESPNLHDYSYKPEPIFYGVSNPYYGIELETDNYSNSLEAAEKLIALSNDEEDYYLKEDSSLVNGIEIVFHPRNFSSWEGFDFQKILSTVKDYNGKSFNTSTCGLHIHRSNRDLSTITKIKLILFFGFCTKQIITVAQRKSCYARFSLFEESKDKETCYKALKDGKYSHYRDQAINFENNDTIEFRVFKGTLKLSTIIAYLAFCHYVVKFCKETILCDFLDSKSPWGSFLKSLKSQKGEMVSNLCTYLKHKELM